LRFCPQCSLILEAVEWNGAAIHTCRTCGGVWLAVADYDRLGSTCAPFRELNSLFPSSISRGIYEGLPKPCPDCRTAQLVRADAATEGANPQSCPKCGGVWLESGEAGMREQESPATPVKESGVPVAAPDEAKMVQPAAVPAPAVVAETAVETERETPVVSPEPKVVAATPVPWLPPVSATMPDPRPMSRRGGPLTPDADDEPAATPPAYQAKRWCPQCRAASYGDEVECPRCRIGLAEGGYRVQCLRCGRENTIAADRCWSCLAAMHSDQVVAEAAPPPLPTVDDLRRMKRQGLGKPPPGSGSCGATMVWLIGGSVAAALITLLMER
jgi:Zn-finger nucleic acid-binding protein